MFQNIRDSLQMLRGYLKVDFTSIPTKSPFFTPADMYVSGTPRHISNDTAYTIIFSSDE